MPIVPDDPNHLGNPGAEAGVLAPWTPGTGVITAVATDAHSGGFAFRLTGGASTSMVQPVSFTFAPNEVWFYGAWVRRFNTPGGPLTLDFEAANLRRLRAIRLDPSGDAGRGTIEWLTTTFAIIKTLPLTAFGYDLTDDPEWIPLWVPVQPSIQFSSMTAVVVSDVLFGGWEVDDLWLSRSPFPIPHGGFHTNGPPEFARGYYDDVHGTIHRDYEVTRDQYERLRRSDDVDELDHDDYKRGWIPRTEQPGEEP